MAQQVDELSIKISSNARQAIRDLNALSASLQKVGTSFRSTGSRLSGLSVGVGKLTRGMTGFGNANRFASKMSKNLTSSLASLALKVFSLTKAFSFLKTGIESAMNFTETVNYFEVAVRDIGRKSAGNWQQAGYRSAEEYVNSFTGRLKNLTTNMTGFKVDEYGNTTEVIGPNLGLDPNQVMQYQAMYTQMSSSMGLTADTAVNMSKALTMLGADWASLRNVDFSESWNKMASALAGQSRAVRAYGIDITNARLQEEAYKYGITDNIQTMSQAEKAQLRLLAILDQSKVAYADLANTMMSYSNQIRYLKQQFSNLSRVIGNLFLPIIAKVLPYINGLIIAFRRLFEEIARILGISLQGINSSMSGISDDYFDMADDSGLADMFSNASDSAEEANQSAEKLKRTVLSFDELHLLNDNSKDENSSSSNSDDNKIPRMGGNPLLDSAIASALGEYESIWSEALARMENRVTEIADRIYSVFQRLMNLIRNRDWVGLGQYIGDGINLGLEAIYDALRWDKLQSGIFDKIDAITTTFNSLVGRINFELIGRIIGNGINIVTGSLNRIYENINFPLIGEQLANGINGLADEVDFHALGATLGNGFMSAWRVLSSLVGKLNYKLLGKDLADEVKGIFDTINFELIASTVSTGINGVFTVFSTFLTDVPWEKYGNDIGVAIKLMVERIDWDLIRETIEQLFTATMDGLKGILEGLGLGSIAEDIETFKNKIVELWNEIDWKTIKIALGYIAEGISAVGTSLIVDLAQIGVDILNGLAKGIKFIGDTISAMPEEAQAFLTGFAEAIAAFAITGLTFGHVASLFGLSKSLGSFVTPLTNLQGIGAVSLMLSLGQALRKLTQSILGDDNAFEHAADNMWNSDIYDNGLPEKIESIGNKSAEAAPKVEGLSTKTVELTEAQQALSETVSTQMTSDMQDWITSLDDATTKSKPLIGKVQELKKETQKAADNTKGLQDKTTGFSLKTALTALKYGLLSSANLKIAETADTATEAYGRMETAAGDAAEGIQSAFDGISIDLTDVGVNAVSSINAGIQSQHISVPSVDVTGYNRQYLTPDQSQWVDWPVFGVNWHAKGAVFTTPTIAGIGEAGPEAVLPLTNKKTMGMIASSIADSGKAFSGMSADDIQEAVATGVAMAMSQNPQMVEVVVNSVLRTSDEKLAQAVSRGRAKLNQRYNPSIVASY